MGDLIGWSIVILVYGLIIDLGLLGTVVNKYVEKKYGYFDSSVIDNYLFSDIRDDNVGILLSKLLFLPMYISILLLLILVVPFFGLYQVFRLIVNIKAIANFFNKKPLEFLKNYSIRIEKR
jgi:hypothetical protein